MYISLIFNAFYKGRQEYKISELYVKSIRINVCALVSLNKIHSVYINKWKCSDAGMYTVYKVIKMKTRYELMRHFQAC